MLETMLTCITNVLCRWK